ncbi:hypothetical protein P9858_07405 [Niallia circulans]|uniref:hypothetical protein n=1 Tax=Niallia circulans TaxID=1397 RepID=UPI002E1B0C18|nr:hypothetical protein [Niallia circulans]
MTRNNDTLGNPIINVIQFVILIVSIVLLFIVYGYIQSNVAVYNQNTLNLFLFTLITLKFILDLYSFGPGLSSYSLLFLYFPIVSILLFGPEGKVAEVFNNNTGLINRHFYLIVFGCFYFYIVWSYLLFYTKKGYKDFDIKIVALFFNTNKSLLATNFFSFIAILSAIIYKPTIPGQSYITLRQVDTLLPGSGWNMVVVIAYFFVLTGINKSKIRKFTLIFVPFWLIINYARVDIMGVLLFYIIYIIFQKGLYKRKNWLFNRTIIRNLILLILIVIIFSYVGIVRNIGLYFSLDMLIEAIFSLFNYPTIQDLVYSFAATVEVEKLYGTTNTILWYFIKIIPSYLISFPEDASKYVQSLITTNYGMHISGEFYLNYSFIGFLIAPFIFYFMLLIPIRLMKWIFGNLGLALAYYLLIMTTARIYWYGYIYYIKPYFTIIPIFLILYYLLCEIEKQIIKNKKR